MASVGKIVKIGALALVAFVGLMGSKWYYTAAVEAIDTQEGVYGMAGMEIWIDLNARMPRFAREWGCTTLRAREKAVLGWNSMPPYSCQPGFGEMADKTVYQTAVDANLGQVMAGLDAAKAEAVKACFEAKMAAAVTPNEVQGMNDFDQAVMSKVIRAVSQSAHACKDEVAG